MKREITTLGIAAVVLLALSAPPAGAQEKVDRRLPAAATGTVQVRNVAGSVRIVGWDRNEVQVQGTLGQGTERLDFENRSGVIVVEVILPERREQRRENRIEGSDLEIRVPAGSVMDVRTVSAGIRVEGVRGELELESVSGEVQTVGDPEEVRASTISGDIDVASSRGPVSANTVSGEVTVGQAVGEFRVKTISGNATVRVRALTDGSFDTIAGNFRFDGDFSGRARLDLESHSGTIELTVPADISARFEVDTFSGSILNAFGQEPVRTSQYVPGRELNFTQGSGEARIRIHVFSGRVEIRKRG
jgi:DUF4097 and DUF4098 domain-containing protein YvlB